MIVRPPDVMWVYNCSSSSQISSSLCAMRRVCDPTRYQPGTSGTSTSSRAPMYLPVIYACGIACGETVDSVRSFSNANRSEIRVGVGWCVGVSSVHKTTKQPCKHQKYVCITQHILPERIINRFSLVSPASLIKLQHRTVTRISTGESRHAQSRAARASARALAVTGWGLTE